MRGNARAVVLALAVTLAAGDACGDWSLSLAKNPEAKDWEKPAIASYTRSDGGARSYMTQGNLSYAFHEWQPLGPYSSLIPSARGTWAKNTLVGQEQDTRGGAAGLKLQLAGENPQNFMLLAPSVGAERDGLKSARSTTASLDAAFGHDLLFSSLEQTPVAFAVLPSLGAFLKSVTDAAADKTTGIKPTGKLRGYYGGVSITVIPNFLGRWNSDSEFLRPKRWKLVGTTQWERTTGVVTGDETGDHRLHTIALSYTFVDPPLIKPPKDSPPQSKLIPGLMLRRQVGSDPWNSVKKGGYTQLAFSLKY